MIAKLSISCFPVKILRFGKFKCYFSQSTCLMRNQFIWFNFVLILYIEPITLDALKCLAPTAPYPDLWLFFILAMIIGYPEISSKYSFKLKNSFFSNPTIIPKIFGPPRHQKRTFNVFYCRVIPFMLLFYLLDVKISENWQIRIGHVLIFVAR